MSDLRPSVLLIGDTLNFGGTEGQFVEVACGLDRSRWDLDIACIRAEGPLRSRLEACGLKPWSCGHGSFKSPRLAAAVLGLASWLKARHVQIVHCFDFYSNVLGVPAARIAGVPAVIASQRDLGNLRTRPQQRIQAAVLRLASHVLVNSNAIAECLAGTHAARSGRLTVIPNGVDVSRFGPVLSPVPRSEGIVIGTLANLRPEKGIGQLIEAAALVARQAPDARFSVWGDGPLRSELEARIRTLGLHDIVQFRGSTREPENALRRCDLFVLPSLSEACSNVVLEAMATGLPVVATRVGGTPALVEDGRSGLLVPPADPKALADAIVRVIREPGLAARIAANARARALAEFGMDRMLKRIEELYRRVLGRDPSRSAVGFRAAS